MNHLGPIISVLVLVLEDDEVEAPVLFRPPMPHEKRLETAIQEDTWTKTSVKEGLQQALLACVNKFGNALVQHALKEARLNVGPELVRRMGV